MELEKGDSVTAVVNATEVDDLEILTRSRRE
jgi:molybdopterin-binding protein